MNKNHLTKGFLGVTLALIACGDEVTNLSDQVGLQTYETIIDFPECTKSNEGEIVLSKENGKVYYCESEMWKTLNGKDGKNGLDGVKGDKGEIGKNGTDGVDGTMCSVEPVENGLEVTCDGKVMGTITNGKNGIQGEQGVQGNPGVNGESCNAIELSDKSGYKIECGGDSVGVILNGAQGAQGIQGIQGEQGLQGNPGVNGESCNAIELSDKLGYKIECGGDSVGVILNGAQGAQGIQGIQGEQGLQGNPGVNGESCNAIELSDKSGYKIECGGDSVGVILNGTQGAQGASGKSCNAIELLDKSGYKIECGGDSVGVILNGTQGAQGEQGLQGPQGENCNVIDKGEGVMEITCGTSVPLQLYKATCGNKSYDPSNEFCYEGELYNLCNGEIFNPKEGICGSGTIIYHYCGSEIYNPKTKVCKNNVLSDKEFFTDDRDNKRYAKVTIGSQTWMAENLNYRVFYERSGDAAKDSGSYCPDNDIAKCEKYGRTYTWAAAMDSANQGGCGYDVTCSIDGNHKGICPTGWHLPSETEWEDLRSFVNTNCDNGASCLKSIEGWNFSGSIKGTNNYGFSAFPIKTERSVGTSIGFWSSTGYHPIAAREYDLTFNSNTLKKYGVNKGDKYSVRCIKDSD